MIVTDTHPLLRFITNKTSGLSKKVLTAFEQADQAENVIYIPSVVFWEIAILDSLGRIKLDERFDYWADKILKKIFAHFLHLNFQIQQN